MYLRMYVCMYRAAQAGRAGRGPEWALRSISEIATDVYIYIYIYIYHISGIYIYIYIYIYIIFPVYIYIYIYIIFT